MTYPSATRFQIVRIAIIAAMVLFIGPSEPVVFAQPVDSDSAVVKQAPKKGAQRYLTDEQKGAREERRKKRAEKQNDPNRANQDDRRSRKEARRNGKNQTPLQESPEVFNGNGTGNGGVTKTAPLTPVDLVTEQGDINIDFKDADIRAVIRAIAELTGKNFIVDEKVNGKVTIISPRTVTLEEALTVFESTLEVYGFSLVESGAVIKILPSQEARQRGEFGSGQRSLGDKIVTRLIPLANVKAQELVNTLRPMVPPTSFLSAYVNTNTLIIVDSAANIDKIMNIVSQLDSATNQDTVTVAQLSYAGAREITEKLEKIFTSGSSGGANRGGLAAVPPQPPGGMPGEITTTSEPKIIPDERINSLIIVASPPATRQILNLVRQLDVPPPTGRGGINVYYLKHADAEEIAKVLGNIAQEAGGPVQPGQPSAAVAGRVNLESDISIVPDKATNSLVITASIEDYETLKGVIDKLDIRRRQVFVEALIMEVTSTKAAEFGVEWRTTADFTQGGPNAIGGVDFGNLSQVAQNPFATPPGLSIGIVDGIISYAGQEFLNIGALVHMLAADSDINILSTPNILTTDNEEAEIVVAQNVPFVTGQSQNTGGTTLTTIERKNIGLTLRIKPQISEAEELKLDVFQEISNISPVQLDKAQDLITSTRSIKTSVIVKNGQNVVLGGLINDDIKEVESRVPGFGDIPLLGWLFKSRTKEKAKTNLLVFLTPHIVDNADEMQLIEERARKNFSNPEGLRNRIEKVDPKTSPVSGYSPNEEKKITSDKGEEAPIAPQASPAPMVEQGGETVEPVDSPIETDDEVVEPTESTIEMSDPAP